MRIRVAIVTGVLVAGLAAPAAGSFPGAGETVHALYTAATSRAARILAFTNRWLGTRYQWGGTTRSGIDCSAFLRQMYRDLFNVELPRTTKQQVKLGVDVAIAPRNPGRALEPGDLIFYIGRDGRPNHVVVYAGNDTITHSVSGRGVVIDPISKVFGRRIVARRFLVPKAGGGPEDRGGFAPIPAAGPLVPQEIPCPDDIRASRREVRTLARSPIQDPKRFGERSICELRALAGALRAAGGRVAEANAAKLEAHALWLEDIEALQGEIGRGW